MPFLGVGNDHRTRLTKAELRIQKLEGCESAMRDGKKAHAEYFALDGEPLKHALNSVFFAPRLAGRQFSSLIRNS
jgi:hypothetical protein